MKKLFMVAIILMVGVGAAMAQKDVKAVGLHLNYGSQIDNVGIGAKFQYGLTDAIRVEPSFNYYLKKDGVGMWDANVNFHYLIDVTEKVKVYPLAGIGYKNWSYGSDSGDGWDDDDWDDDDYDWDDDDDWSRSGASRAADYEWDWSDDEEDDDSVGSNKVVVNVGIGAQYQLNEKLSIGAELKYQIISNFNQVVFAIGATYRF